MENYSPGEILETVAPKPFSMLHSYGDGKISCFFPFLFIFCHWYIMILALLSDFDIVCPCPRRLSRVGLVGAPAWKWHRSKYFIFHICVGAVFTSWPGYLLFLLNTAAACFLFPSRIRAQPSILIVRYLAKISDKQHSHPDTYNAQYISVNEC